MHHSKHAILISLDSSTTEIEKLAQTLGYTLLHTFIQRRDTPDVNYFVGSGKLDEIAEYVSSSKTTVDLVIINGELKPSQWFMLEKKLSVDVYDRIRLILEIFKEHAKRKEARLQVKLAQLHYERPYVRELIHRARSGEHPGLMAGGEYQVDDYYEMIKKQMKKIRSDLDKIRKDREVHRKTRYKSGCYLVSLAGYTNAGKSSLLNLLSDESVTVEGKLFSTLSTTTRRIPQRTKGNSLPILLTDTVGFIENLPSWVVDAFHSTLEEIEVADVVVLVVDGSEHQDIVKKKLQVSLDELLALGVTASVIIAINKIDIIDQEKLDSLLSYLTSHHLLTGKECVPISVEKKINIERFLQILNNNLPNLVKLILQVPANKESQNFISQLYNLCRVLTITYDKKITIEIECNSKIQEKIIATMKNLHGVILNKKTKYL